MRLQTLSLILFLTPAGPLAADWLVGRDGSRIETRGAWKVTDSEVIFTLKNGTLSSLRLSEVDLDASARFTAERKAAPVLLKPLPARREPILVLTNRDIRRASDVTASGDQDVPRAAPEAPEKPAVEPGLLEVIAWDVRDSAETGGIEVSGTLRNDSDTIVTDVAVTVTLFDHRGAVVARGRGFLDAVSVAARSTTSFRALFADVDFFAGEPRFEVHGEELIFGDERRDDAGEDATRAMGLEGDDLETSS